MKYFLALSNSGGETVTPGHVRWLAVDAYTLSASADLSLGLDGFDRQGVDFGEIGLTFATKAGLKALTEAMMDLGFHGKLSLHAVTDRGNVTVSKIDLGGVLFSDLGDFSAGGLNVSFGYQTIEVKTLDQAAGRFDGFAWNTATDGPIRSVQDIVPVKGSFQGSVAPSSYFLAVSGLNGGSEAPGLAGYFALSEFRVEATRSVDGPSQDRGPLDMGQISFRIEGTQALSRFMAMMAEGDDVPAMRVVGVQGDLQSYKLLMNGLQINQVFADRGGYTVLADFHLAQLTLQGPTDRNPRTLSWDADAHVKTTETLINPRIADAGDTTGALPPQDYVLTIEGVSGGGVNDVAPGGFDVLFHEWNAGKGAAVFGDSEAFDMGRLSLVLASTAALTEFQALLANVKVESKLTLTGLSDALGAQAVVEALTLDDFKVTHVSTAADGTVRVELIAEKWSLQTLALGLDGDLVAETAFSWDRDTDSAGTAALDPAKGLTRAAGITPQSYFVAIDDVAGSIDNGDFGGWSSITGFDLSLARDFLDISPLPPKAGELQAGPLVLSFATDDGLLDLMRAQVNGTQIAGLNIKGLADFNGLGPEMTYNLVLGGLTVVSLVNLARGGFTAEFQFDTYKLVTFGSDAGSDRLQKTRELAFNVGDVGPADPVVVTPGAVEGETRIANFYFVAVSGMEGDIDRRGKAVDGYFEAFDVRYGMETIVNPVNDRQITFASTVEIDFVNEGQLGVFMTMVSSGALAGLTIKGLGGRDTLVEQIDLRRAQFVGLQNNEGIGFTVTLSLDQGQIGVKQNRFDPLTGALVGNDFVGWNESKGTPLAEIGGKPIVPKDVTQGARPADHFFMVIENISGTSSDPDHANWFDVDHYEFSVDHSGAKMGRMTVDFATDDRLATFMAHLAQGSDPGAMEFEGRASAAEDALVFDISFSNVRVAAVHDTEGQGFEVTFAYQQYVYTSLNSNGGVIAQTSWDFLTD